MPDDPKKPKPTKPFAFAVDNPLVGAVAGTVYAATAAEAERQVREWLAHGLAVTPADKG